LTLLKGWTLNDMSLRYRLFRWTMCTLGVLFLGFEVHGKEKVPEKEPLIVAANHRRFFDPVFVSMAVPRRVRWMAKK
jgi:1-acyl-sn-glycerol-3-phosphate acyltransferase